MRLGSRATHRAIHFSFQSRVKCAWWLCCEGTHQTPPCQPQCQLSVTFCVLSRHSMGVLCAGSLIHEVTVCKDPQRSQSLGSQERSLAGRPQTCSSCPQQLRTHQVTFTEHLERHSGRRQLEERSPRLLSQAPECPLRAQAAGFRGPGPGNTHRRPVG